MPVYWCTRSRYQPGGGPDRSHPPRTTSELGGQRITPIKFHSFSAQVKWPNGETCQDKMETSSKPKGLGPPIANSTLPPLSAVAHGQPGCSESGRCGCTHSPPRDAVQDASHDRAPGPGAEPYKDEHPDTHRFQIRPNMNQRAMTVRTS